MPVPTTLFLGGNRRRLRPVAWFPTAPSAGRARRLAWVFSAAACLALAPALPARAADAAHGRPSQRDVLAGPVEARVIRVRDGDTLVVAARIWVGQEIVIDARINGI
ncbi:MAG: hypothetical protein E2O90_11840, partial [Alphaproteobacteria bacterium]